MVNPSERGSFTAALVFAASVLLVAVNAPSWCVVIGLACAAVLPLSHALDPVLTLISRAASAVLEPVSSRLSRARRRVEEAARRAAQSLWWREEEE